MPCTFESVKVDGDGGDFHLRVRYAYEADGVRHVGTRYSVSQGGTFVFTLPRRIEGRRIVWRLGVKYARLADVFCLDVDDDDTPIGCQRQYEGLQAP